MEPSKYPKDDGNKVKLEKKVKKKKNPSKNKKKKLEARRKKIMLPKDKKLKQPKASSNVLILNTKKHQKDSAPKKFIKIFIAVFYEYAAITKVNGMYYLRRNVTTSWLRFFWSCVMIILMTFAGTLIFLLYRRYLESPTRVTIASPMSINSIPFPGVTICHPQNIMEYKSKEFVTKM